MSRRFAVLDVFTSRPLSGNGLAVVRDCDGLDTAAMQAIARAFCLSETVFLCPPEGPAHSARARIFTPARELPFAGHPTVGAAVLVALDRFGAGGAGQEAVVVLEETVGAVRCGVRLGGPRTGYAAFDLPRGVEAVPFAADRAQIAAALGLGLHEIGFENHVPCAFTAGVPYVFVPVAGLAAAGRAAPVAQHWPAAFAEAAGSVFVYCRESVGAGVQFHARMFAPELGIVEDPATGSAVSAFAAVVHRFDRPVEGVTQVMVEQGLEMLRPSRIRLEIEVAGGRLARVRIGGDAVVVQEGELFV
ncbi:PhzF family phenazine biosynthesis protein [Pseudoxanthobacter sp.]|uniref:PhzF family phenazine biosynthesis protein n=1 Tax=Pseudoxanthobacter sp. TaxID=1925742 RepID=UPI002FDFD276